MFTGLVENTGVLTGRSGADARIAIRPAKRFDDLVYGESIAVNGACLTLEKVRDDGILEFYTLEETLARTNLGLLEFGSGVNLERAMKLGGRLGGHLVTGHIDAVGTMLACDLVGGDVRLTIGVPALLRPYLVPKGSIAIDGVSLTLIEVEEDRFTVELIPVTLQETALHEREPGAPVNLEGDILGKYVERQLQLMPTVSRHGGGVTMSTLLESGW
ncbi:MAG: riboflavin synthase [Victivallales bacterium]|nr:riboflavin synthase [Victivallales bacterium]